MLESRYKWNVLSEKKENILDTLLENRKIQDKDEFLNMRKFKLYDSNMFKDIEKVFKRLKKAKDNEEKIVIFGDYDVDGITSTSILYKFFKFENFNIDYYIPHRIEEGYGLNKDAIKELSDANIDLIITVDNGITAIEEVKYANKLGIDVIITDHHEPMDKLPEAVGIIDPKRKDSTYPFKELAGCGIAYKLVIYLKNKFSSTFNIQEVEDLVLIGTVADIVPLVDENRYIVKSKIKTLNRSKNLGIRALLEVTDQIDKEISAMTIGYIIGPRLNAAGRLGNAEKAVDLLTTEDKDEAIKIAEFLDSQNVERKKIGNNIYIEAVKKIEKENRDKDNIIIVYGENWHHGVIGIVASKLVDKYYKPVIVLSLDDDVLKGSARSIEGFSIFEAIYSVKDLTEKFGGHEMAAGLSLKIENIKKFRKLINLKTKIPKDLLIPKLDIDMKVKSDKIDLKLLDEMEKLKPFGAKNKSPLFLVKGKLNRVKAVGNNSKHLKFEVNNIGCIAFNMGENIDYIKENDLIEVVGSFEKNEWNNNVNPQINVRDMASSNNEIKLENYYNSLVKKFEVDKLEINNNFFEKDLRNVDLIGVNTIKGLQKAEEILKGKEINYKIFYNYREEFIGTSVVVNPIMIEPNMVMFDMTWDSEEILVYDNSYKNHIEQLDDMIPTRDDFIKIYKFLKLQVKFDRNKIDVRKLKASIDINTFKLYLCLDVFKELKLINYERKKNNINFICYNNIEVSLEKSEILKKLKKYKKNLKVKEYGKSIV